jgi:hypothetical protein
MEHDGNWMLSLPADAAAPDDGAGPLLSNGTVGLIPALATGYGLDTVTSVVAAAEPWRQQLLEGFHFCRFRLFSPSLMDTEHHLVSAEGLTLSLHMGTGTLTAPYVVTRASDGRTLCSVVHDVRALRHLPHFVLHTLAVTVPADLEEGFQVFHEVRTQLPGAEYASTVLYNEAAAANSMGGRGTYLLVGQGGSAKRVHVACCYLWEQPHLVDNTGYSTLRNESSCVLNRFVLRQRTPEVETPPAYRTHVLHVLTGTGCSVNNAGESDVAERMNQLPDQLRRAILGQLARGPTPAAVAEHLLERHTDAWADLWITDIQLQPKLDATPEEAADVRKVVRALKYAMYNLHASVRVGSVVDLEGTVGQGAHDAFVVPAYLLLNPEAALSALDARYVGLADAARAALTFGLRGAKFPYEGDDTSGYDTALFWDAEVPLRVFNTALVGVNAWNYYRVTRDKDWLLDRGYAVLRAVADMVSSAADTDPDDPGAYHLENIVSFEDHDAPVTDNALTVACAQLALRGAIEASYELGYTPKPMWVAVRYGLQVPFNNAAQVGYGADVSLMRRDATNAGPGPIRVLEPLLVLSPWLSSIVFGFDSGAPTDSASALLSNVPFWLAQLREPARPVNSALRVQALAQLAQVGPPESADGVAAAALGFLTAHADAGWGNLRNFESRTGANDLNLSAALVMAFMQGLAGIQVTGGVTETRFYYAELGVTAFSASRMPRTWERLILKGVGNAQLDFVVLNSVLYGESTDTVSLTVPWSVDTLT